MFVTDETSGEPIEGDDLPLPPNSDPHPNADRRAQGRRVLREEAAALYALADRLDATFDRAVHLLVTCRGRVVVTGMGKSGHVGRKITGTLASTGTPALFLHPAEALHGDLGMVTGSDVVLALSYSGETDELLAVLPALRRRADALIAVTGNPASTLGRAADLVLDVQIGQEACALQLAPTTSTTAMIALGDALAIATMTARGFMASDYALLHPAGSLGRRLLLRVSDLMATGERLALVAHDATVRDVVLALPRAGQSAALVVAPDGTLAGLITEGDLRRGMARWEEGFLSQPVAAIMTACPLTISPDALAAHGLHTFNEAAANIRELPVVDAGRRPVGMLMLNDLLRAGIV